MTAQQGPIKFPTQEQVMAWVERQGYSKHIDARVMKLAEESGEVMGAVVKIPEGRKTIDDLAMELAQLVICAMGVAEAADLDLWQAVEDEWERTGHIPICPGVAFEGGVFNVHGQDGITCQVCGADFSYALSDGVHPPKHLAAVSAIEMGC